jgi:hypothetical protein
LREGHSSSLPRSLRQAERDQDTCMRYAGVPWRKTAPVPIKSRETESHMQQDNNVLCSGLWIQDYDLDGVLLVSDYVGSGFW